MFVVFIDFIIVVFGEEFGLVGLMVILMFYIIVIIWGLCMVIVICDSFGKLLVVGFLLMLVI